MTSPLSRFTYDTFDVQKSKRATIKISGHRLGALAAVRKDLMCPSCDKLHEAWSILHLPSGSYGFPLPVFNTLDDAANYILDVIDLCDWTTVTEPTLKPLTKTLIVTCLRHGGIPFSLLSTLMDDPIKGDIPPGTIGLNGYTPH